MKGKPPAIPLRLFVYGTLMRGYWNHERFCQGALSVEEATVTGRLYELSSGIPVLDVPKDDIIAVGTFDAAHDLLIQERQAPLIGRHSDDSQWLQIRGELTTFADPISRLRAIDALEGFVPSWRCLYRRVLLPVYRQDGAVVAAWCYVLALEGVHLAATDKLQWGADL